MSSGNTGLMTPGRDEWGQYRLPDGQVVNVRDVSEQIYYDSDLIPATPGTGEYIFARNPTFSTGAVKVFGRDYNIPEWGRVPKDWYYTIINVGFFARAGIPSFDLQALANFGYMRMITGSQKIEQDGLLILFPFGVGIGGSIAIANPVATEASALNIGSPASASILARKYDIDLPDQTTYETRLQFPGAAGAVFSAMIQVYFALRVIRYRPPV
jgi:hypothetical protein